jgi:hypothetical protein
MSQTLHSFRKNALEEVRASLTEYKTRQYIDLRVFYKADNDEFRPSKKGLTLSPELLPELEEALSRYLKKGDYILRKPRKTLFS